MNIIWKQKKDIKGKPLEPESYTGYIGKSEIAMIKLETHKISNISTWYCVFYAERAHYFADTLEEIMNITQQYWDDYYMRLHSADDDERLEEAKNRMWH